MIEVKRMGDGNPMTFDVRVTEGAGETHHEVTLSEGMCRDLFGNGADPADCVSAAFRFLLEREPKESILGRFDIGVISRYFPEFEARIREYMA